MRGLKKGLGFGEASELVLATSPSQGLVWPGGLFLSLFLAFSGLGPLLGFFWASEPLPACFWASSQPFLGLFGPRASQSFVGFGPLPSLLWASGLFWLLDLVFLGPRCLFWAFSGEPRTLFWGFLVSGPLPSLFWASGLVLASRLLPSLFWLSQASFLGLKPLPSLFWASGPVLSLSSQPFLGRAFSGLFVGFLWVSEPLFPAFSGCRGLF